MSASERVHVALEIARRRLALLGATRRAGWFSLSAVVALELGLATRAALPPVAWTCLIAAAALVLLAVSGIVTAGRPSAMLAAEVLDARLGHGAVLASASEVLDGQHPRFGPRVLLAAGSALDGVELRRLLPLRAPPGLVLGAAAAVLLPFVLPSSSAGHALSTRELPSLLDAELLAAGAGSQPDAEAGTTPSAFAPVLGAPPQEQPGDALPLDTLELLRTKVGELASSLPSAEGGGGSLGSPNADALDEALDSGDLARVLAALERLAQAAGEGDRAAAAKIAELAEGLGAPGAGGAAAQIDPSAPDVNPPDVNAATGGELRLPPQFAEACARYF